MKTPVGAGSSRRADTPWPLGLLFPGILPILLLPEDRDLLLDALVVPGLQFRAVSEEEQNLHPDKQRCEQEGLDQVVQQRGSPTLEDSVADELHQPRRDVDASKPIVHAGAVCDEEMVCECRASEQDWRDKGAGDGFKEDVEGGIYQRADRSDIGREVFEAQDIGDIKEDGGVGGLDYLV